MPYSSNLTDSEWFILEPLLHQILPVKKQNRPPSWTKREILDGIFYQLKNGCNPSFVTTGREKVKQQANWEQKKVG